MLTEKLCGPLRWSARVIHAPLVCGYLVVREENGSNQSCLVPELARYCFDQYFFDHSLVMSCSQYVFMESLHSLISRTHCASHAFLAKYMQIDHRHLKKEDPEIGMLVVKVNFTAHFYCQYLVCDSHG